MDEQIKQFKAVLKNELSPLIISLKNALKENTRITKRLLVKKFPTDVKATITNPVTEMKVSNPTEPTDMGGIEEKIENMTKALGLFDKAVLKGLKQSDKQFGELLDAFFEEALDVNVKNQITLPKEWEVKVMNQLQLPDIQKVLIQNRKPSEAIPVVLTTKSLKEFYTVISSMSGGGSKGTPSKNTGTFGAVSVGTTATLIRPKDVERISLLITVNSNVTVFFGFDNTVTTASGTPLKQDDVFEIDQDNLYTGDVFAIVASGTADIRFMEI